MENIWEALADETRRKILIILRDGELTAGQIHSSFDITKPSLSHHLNILKEANLVKYRKERQSIYYSLNISAFNEVIKFVKELRK